MTGLARNGYADPAFFDDLADLLQQNGRAVQIHFQNGFNRSLTGGNARRVDEHGNVSIFLRLANQIHDGFS